MPLSPGKRDLLLDYVISSEVNPLYLALLQAPATSVDTGTTIVEVTYGGYARAAVALADWDAALDGIKTNGVDVSFPVAASGDLALGWALVDAASGGLLIAYKQFPTVAITTGRTPKFSPGGFGITLNEEG